MNATAATIEAENARRARVVEAAADLVAKGLPDELAQLQDIAVSMIDSTPG